MIVTTLFHFAKIRIISQDIGKTRQKLSQNIGTTRQKLSQNIGTTRQKLS